MRRTCLPVAAFVLALATRLPLAAAAAPAAPADKAKLDGAFTALSTYDWGHDRKALTPIDQAANASKGDPALRQDLEKRLLAVLASKAGRAAKDYACRKLALIGTTASVPALAALLPDADLSHMGRYALERMAYPEAGKALRDALPRTKGRVKVGVINSLGAREDTEAAGALIALLKDPDAEIAGAAAAALGKAATPDAVRALAGLRAKAPKALHTIVVDASLDVASRLLRKGQKDEAAKIYTELDAPAQPRHVRLAAFQGLVTAHPTEAVPRLVKALAGDQAPLRNLAAQLIADTQGEQATKALAAALPGLPPTGQAALLGALADRGDRAARPAALDALKSKDKGVRGAAIAALAALGNAADVTLLAGIAATDKDAAPAARASLARLKGDDVNRAIAAAVSGAAPAVRVELLRALAARGAKGAQATVVAQVADADAGVRLAALDALGTLGGAEQSAVAVKALKAAKDSRERAAAEKALLAIASRAREQCAGAVLAGLQGADTASRCVLLRALARVGGAKALAAIRAATADKDSQVRDAAVRSLANWPDTAAAEPLLALAKAAGKTPHQVLALRGYVRLAGLHKSNDVKLKMLREAMALTTRPDEKKRILAALGTVPTLESFEAILPHLETPALAEEAGAAAVRIADPVGRKNKALVRDAMAKVLAKTKNRRTRRDAQRMLGRLKK